MSAETAAERRLRMVAGDDTAEPQEAAGDEQEATCYLPDEFYAARPVLDQINRAARSKRIARDALLGSVLARVAYLTPPDIMVPDIVGTPQPLNLAAVLLGFSGGSKSVAMDQAEILLPDEPQGIERYRRREITIGSGEGLSASYFAEDKVKGDDGKTRIQMVREYDGILQVVDEGEALIKLMERSGATLSTQLRSAVSGSALGWANANNRRPMLPKKTYRYCLLMAIQPEKAAPLIEDGAGTPQRLLFFAASDPLRKGLERPSWPGRIKWSPPLWDVTDPTMVDLYGGPKRLMTVDPFIAELIIQAHDEQGERDLLEHVESEDDALDGHRNLNQLKVACLFALLDRRLHVNGEDWWLAEWVMATSDSVRDVILMRRNAGAARKAEQRIAAEVAAVEAKANHHEDGVDRARRKIVAKLRRVGQPMRKAELRDCLGTDKKHDVTALESLIEDGVIERTEDGRATVYTLVA